MCAWLALPDLCFSALNAFNGEGVAMLFLLVLTILPAPSFISRTYQPPKTQESVTLLRGSGKPLGAITLL